MTQPIDLTQLKFDTTDKRIEAYAPKSNPELRPIAEVFNDFGRLENWHDALDTLDGKLPFPYWTGGDSMEIEIEEDGTWFREQEEWRHSDGIKVSNKDAREIISRFIEACKAIE